MADKKSNPQQIAQSVFNPESESVSIRDITNLVPNKYDEILMSYVNANPEPSSVTYRYNSIVVAIIGFEYDNSGRVIRVHRIS